MTDDDLFPGLEETLSLDRFGTYLAWAGGDRGRAVALYTLNTTLSESLYTPLHMLEVALRNRIHQVMTVAAGDHWYDQAEHQLNPYQADMVGEARKGLTEKGKAVTPGAMVAALTFGFWIAMLGKDYDPLWRSTLHRIAKDENGRSLQRKDFTRPLGAIRTLRNRVAHHEPIIHWKLPKNHAEIVKLIGWLSAPAASWCHAHDRFDTLYPAEGIALAAAVDADAQPDAAPAGDRTEPESASPVEGEAETPPDGQ